MLSSDKNVETIGQLIESLRRYIELQKEYLKFDIVEKSVRLISALILGVIVFVLLIAILFYLSFAAVYWMEPLTGIAGAFAIVALFFLVLLFVVAVFWRSLIVRPVVRFLARILME